MDDSRLYDLNNDLDEMAADYATDRGVMLEHRIALLQVRAIAVLAEQVNQFGTMIEGFIEDATEVAPRRRRIRRWLS